MKTLGVFEAKTRFSAIVDSAAAGETTVITKNGKPVAELAPLSAHRASRAKAAMTRLNRTRERLAAGGKLRGLDIRELIYEDRK
ncbi:MAG: type II toxin-antitoxin system prevent-host-death family antitoxin [Candidatus Baltobacteraceae bacterium]